MLRECQASPGIYFGRISSGPPASRRARRQAAAIVVLLGTAYMGSCGGGSSSSGGTGGMASGTPAGSYGLTITGTSNAGSRTTEVSLTVQ